MSKTAGKITTSHSEIQEITLEATIIRCACGHPQSHPEQVCPQGISEPRGVIADYYRSRWKRFCAWLRRIAQRGN